MVLQAQGNDALCLFHRSAMPRFQERKRRHLLRPAGVSLIAWQGSENLSKTVAPNDRCVGAIRTVLADNVSLRQLALRHIERFPAADANCGTTAGIRPFSAQDRLFKTPRSTAM
jgi:hypothetical protein